MLRTCGKGHPVFDRQIRLSRKDRSLWSRLRSDATIRGSCSVHRATSHGRRPERSYSPISRRMDSAMASAKVSTWLWSAASTITRANSSVPEYWLGERMTKLGTVIVEHIVVSYGPSEFLARLSDPFWFQALGCVMGMDWHSSGITTSVMGALKRGLNPRSSDLGLYICGGRGRHSRRTPDELRACASQTGLDGDALARTSRLTARVDNNAIGDGFQLYLD